MNIKKLKLSVSIVALQVSVAVVGSSSASASPAEIAFLLQKSRGYSQPVAEYVAETKPGDRIGRVHEIEEAKKIDAAAGAEDFVQQKKTNPLTSTLDILRDLGLNSDAKKSVVALRMNAGDANNVKAAKAIKTRGINLNPTADEINATKALFGQGLKEANLNADYIAAYHAGGDDQAAALEFAKEDIKHFDADYKAAWGAAHTSARATRAEEEAALVTLSKLEAYNADHVATVQHLAAAGLTGANMNVRYAAAYHAGGQRQAAAVAFATADAQHFDGAYEAAWEAARTSGRGRAAEEQAAFVTLATLEARDADHEATVQHLAAAGLTGANMNVRYAAAYHAGGDDRAAAMAFAAADFNNPSATEIAEMTAVCNEVRDGTPGGVTAAPARGGVVINTTAGYLAELGLERRP